MTELFHQTICKITAHNVVHDWYAPFRSPYENESIGTGFFISNDGYILTCSHVVEDAIKLEITIPILGKKKYSAKIISISPDYDIAVLKTDYKNNNFLKLTDSDLVKQGDTVHAVGYPLGQDKLKVSQGIISGTQEHLFQTDAPINPGNSGGPLLDIHNDVIAINSQKISASTADNIGYSVPINFFKLLRNRFIPEIQVMPSIIYKPLLLCKFSIIDDYILDYNELKDEGYLISKINENSCLYKSGIRQYDILLEIGGYKIDNFGEVKVEWSNEKFNIKYLLYRFTVDQKIQIKFYNIENKFQTTEVCLKYPKFEIDNIYLNLMKESIDYEIISGLVLCDLKLNHLHRHQMMGANLSKNVMHKMISFNKSENRFKKKILLCNVLPGSYTYSNNDIESGLILNKINDEDITSTQDLREHLIKLKDANEKYLKLTFDNSNIIILNFENIKKEHLALSKQYRYNNSILINKLFGVYDINYSKINDTKSVADFLLKVEA